MRWELEQEAKCTTLWSNLPALSSVVALLLSCISGCERHGVPTIPVMGKITYGGGAWPAAGTLYFTPLEPADGMPQRPGRARFEREGTFRAQTFADADGLIPGRYCVNVECWETPPSMDASAAEAKSFVPTKYQSGRTSGFEVMVDRDGKGAVELNLDVPKS
jgi:hypothetical protein